MALNSIYCIIFLTEYHPMFNVVSTSRYGLLRCRTLNHKLFIPYSNGEVTSHMQSLP